MLFFKYSILKDWDILYVLAVVEPGRARTLVASWETREKSLTADTPVLVSGRPTTSSGLDMSSFIPVRNV